MSATRRCRIEGCENQHQRSMFCCQTHWYLLPKPMRDEIWRTVSNPGVMTNEFLQAAENAEAFLEDREPKTVDVFS